MDLIKIEKEVLDLCGEVAHFIRQESSHFDRARIEQKGSFSNLVSYVDKESEKKIVNTLKKIIPGSGFLAEEGTDSKSENEYQWIIDPLDGTTNFLHGLPIFAISIALRRNDQVVLGVVHEVTHGECFHAIEHGKATNEVPHWNDILPYMHDKSPCPLGGKYTLGPPGGSPTCSIPGHNLP